MLALIIGLAIILSASTATQAIFGLAVFAMGCFCIVIAIARRIEKQIIGYLDRLDNKDTRQASFGVRVLHTCRLVFGLI